MIQPIVGNNLMLEPIFPLFKKVPHEMFLKKIIIEDLFFFMIRASFQIIYLRKLYT